MTPRPEYGTFVPMHPDMELVDGRMVLLEPLTYIAPNGIEHTARKGLRTDGASVIGIPVASLFLGHPWSKSHGLAAIIHDQLCQDARRIGGPGGYRLRCYADALYPYMVLACGGSMLRANAEHAGVVLGRWAEAARWVYR